MSDFDWKGLGDSIQDLVQDAVESRDFDKLSSNISRTVQQAMDGVSSSMREAGMAAGRAMDEAARNLKQGQRNYGQQSSQFQKNAQFQQNSYGQPGRTGYQSPCLFQNIGKNQVIGTIQAVLGYVFAVFFGVGVVMFLSKCFYDLWLGMPDGGNLFGLVLYLVLTGGCLALGLRGSSSLGLSRRFQKYIRILGGRTFCELQELAMQTGKDLKYIRKDVRRMVEKNWFLEGHLDRQETCLIVTNEVYHQYLQMEKQRLLRQQQEQHQKLERENVPAQVQEVLKAGEAYIKRIRKCNDDIPGEEISAKISRTEELIRQIFTRVEKCPESVSDIRKLMDYYLPTTVKLLDAYAELDAQPVQGEHIANSKREIEEALDTLNTAFEKLLDSLFRDKAWDVSADISVLETMLAQEGLTNQDFK